MRVSSTLFVALVAGLALLQPGLCDEHDHDFGGDPEEGGYGGGDDEGYGGGGGEEEEAPPPTGDAKELTTVEELDEFINDLDASVVAAFSAKEMKDPTATLPEGWDEDEDGEWEAPTIENPALTKFNELTGSVYGYRYAYTTAPEVLAKLKCKATAGLYLFRSPKFVSTEAGDRPRERFPSDVWSESGVKNWLSAKSQPLVGYYSSSTSSRYEGATVIIFMNLDFDTNTKGVNYVLKRARKVAASFKGKLAFAVAKSADMSYDMEDFGLQAKSTASDIKVGIKATTAGETSYYGSEAAFTAASLTTFAESFLAGTLDPYVKPPPPPYEPDDPPNDYDDDEGASDYSGDEEGGEEEEAKDEM